MAGEPSGDLDDAHSADRQARAAESIGFEAAYQELQQVVQDLEEGGLALDDALRLFERGTQLVQVCQQLLDQAEMRITRLAGDAAAVAELPAEH